MRKIELLVPASSLEVLKIAVIFGADAVYIGGEAFGLRAKAKNFSHEDMKEGIAFAHEHGVKVYVTVNILAHNYDLPGVQRISDRIKRTETGCPDHCRSGNLYCMQRKSARRSSVISVHRQTIPIMKPIVSGTIWVPNVW